MMEAAPGAPRRGRRKTLSPGKLLRFVHEEIQEENRRPELAAAEPGSLGTGCKLDTVTPETKQHGVASRLHHPVYLEEGDKRECGELWVREGPRGALEAVWWSSMERRQDEGLMRDLSNSNTPSRNPRTPAASRTVQLGGEDVADASFGWTNSRVPAIDLTLTMTGAAVGTLCSPSMRLVFEGDEGLAAAKRAMAALQEQVQPVSGTAACADKEDDEGFDLPVLVRAFLQDPKSEESKAIARRVQARTGYPMPPQEARPVPTREQVRDLMLSLRPMLDTMQRTKVEEKERLEGMMMARSEQRPADGTFRYTDTLTMSEISPAAYRARYLRAIRPHVHSTVRSNAPPTPPPAISTSSSTPPAPQTPPRGACSPAPPAPVPAPARTPEGGVSGFVRRGLGSVGGDIVAELTALAEERLQAAIEQALRRFHRDVAAAHAAAVGRAVGSTEG